MANALGRNSVFSFVKFSSIYFVFWDFELTIMFNYYHRSSFLIFLANNNHFTPMFQFYAFLLAVSPKMLLLTIF